MSEQQHHATSSQNDHLPQWIRLCRWLWKFTAFLGTAVVVALGVNVTSTWLTTPKGVLPANTPLSALMTNWPISLLVGCCLLLLALIFWIISHWSVPASTIPAITPRDRERLLQRLHVRYEQLLAQSLQGTIQIELGLASRPAAIRNAMSLSLRLPEQPEHVLPPQTTIIDAYELAQQELLILGEPGAGKSTLLLELAHHLVKHAKQDEVQPLPVLLPLSSWATKRLPLQDWLIEQFTLLYDVPRQISHDWMQVGLVLPLLDGLDEMEVSARAICIKTINMYHHEHLLPLVVCSRTNEYDAATRHERLALHTAIIVQPLTLEQIDAHLAIIGKPVTALRTALKKNATLRTLATTPLLLQILMLTYHDIPIRALSHKEGQVREQIWSDYAQQMVSRKGNTTRYPLEQTCAWLGWLARQMRLQNQTIFSLEQLQPNWLPKRRKILYRWNVGLLTSLLSGLIIGLVVGVLSGLVVGVLSGLVVGVLSGLVVGRDTTIEPAEALIWSQKGKGLRYGLIIGLLVWLLFELFFGQFFGQFNIPFGLIVGLLVGLLSGLLAGLIAGLSGTQFTERLKLFPNEGIRRSMKNGLLTGLLIWLLVGLLSGLLIFILAWLENVQPNWLLAGLVFAPLFGLRVGMAFGLFFGLFFGLRAALQHYTLRFWLWRSHLFPLKAVPFLEDATARILLRRVGGSYSFTHRLLMDYFADLETTHPSPLLDAPPKLYS